MIVDTSSVPEPIGPIRPLCVECGEMKSWNECLAPVNDGGGLKHNAAEDEVGNDEEEGVVQKGMKCPYKPTQQEKENHARSHIPFRSWCKHCVRGKSKSSPHPSSNSSEERQKPVISFDYAFFGGTDEEDAEKNGHTAFLIMHDTESRAVYAYVTERKGIDERLCKRVVADLENLGYKEVVMKSDQEPALENFLEVVKANWNADVVPEESPVGNSQSNGAIERAIQTWKGQVRTLKDALESRIVANIDPSSKIMCWLVEYAATLMRRCSLGPDGRTAYQKMKGRVSKRGLVEFGEKVWYRPLRARTNSLDVVMAEGVFVGVLDRSDEVLIVTKDGLIKSRDVRRQPEDDRWCKERVLEIEVTPNDPNGGTMDLRVKTFIKPGLENPDVARPVEPPRAVGVRRTRLFRSDFEAHGLTIGCGGCKAISRRSSQAANHSESCRKRIEKELIKSAHGRQRLERSEMRITETLAEKIEEVARAQSSGQKRDREEAVIEECLEPSSKAATLDQGANHGANCALDQGAAHSEPISGAVDSNGKQGGPKEDEDMLQPEPDARDGGDQVMDDTEVKNEDAMDVAWVVIDEAEMPALILNDREASARILDLSADRVGGKPWNFGEEYHREQAMMSWKTTQPGLVVISLVNTVDEFDRQMFAESLEDRVSHAVFCAELCEWQRIRGLYYLLRIPKGSAESGLAEIKKLQNHHAAMTIVNKDGIIVTNNIDIADDILQSSQATGNRQREILRRSARERREVRRWADLMDQELETMDLELNICDEDEMAGYAWEDVKQVELDIAKVRKARKLEMEYIEKRRVYKYATRGDAKSCGQNVIGTKWIDTNKGDEMDENYRSRLVAQEFRRKEVESLYLQQRLLLRR